MEDFLTQRDFDIQKELGCRISMYLWKILWQRKNVSYRIFYSLDWFDTIGKYSILREYVLRMNLMHSGNLVILYTMSGCIPSYGVHCPSRNTPQRNLRKRGDLIWGDLVAHSDNHSNEIWFSLQAYNKTPLFPFSVIAFCAQKASHNKPQT